MSPGLCLVPREEAVTSAVLVLPSHHAAVLPCTVPSKKALQNCRGGVPEELLVLSVPPLLLDDGEIN